MIDAKLDKHLRDCRHCDATVVWVTSTGGALGKAGATFPVDADPTGLVGGRNIALNIGPETVTATAVTAGQAAGMTAAGFWLYSHHALTCPKAKEWHKLGAHGVATRKLGTRR